MKANAPEKIYINPLLMEEGESIVRHCTFERQSDSQVEYIRKDAFIEKAVDYIKKDMLDNLAFQGRLNRVEIIDGIIEKFIKAMKGE